MNITSKLRDLFNPWQDPYEYECTACGRAFQSEQRKCTDCGGTVERRNASDGVTPADPQP